MIHKNFVKVEKVGSFDPLFYDYVEELKAFEDENHWYMPKFFDKTNFCQKYFQGKVVSLPKLKEYKDQFENKLKCRYELKPYQVPVVKKLLNLFEKQNYLNGIVQLSTGFGKTFLSLYLANELKLKTIIVVDTSVLFNQWIERILEYFPELSENDIGKIKGKEYFVPKSAPFTVCFVQTLNAKLRNMDNTFFRKIAKENFGLVIFDEVHKLSASKKYAKISSMFDTKNVIGLSATPYKYGVQKVLLESSVGKVIISKQNFSYKPKILLVRYKSNLKDFVSRQNFWKTKYMGKLEKVKAMSMYSSLILDSPKYIRLISSIAKVLNKLNHKTIIIASTIKQCDTLSKHIENSCSYHSKNKNVNLNEFDVIVGTYKSCSHGFDKKDLSAVVFAVPFSGKVSIPQIVGRILREYEGKKEPVVVYLIDDDFPYLFNVIKAVNVLKQEYGNCNVELLDFTKDFSNIEMKLENALK